MKTYARIVDGRVAEIFEPLIIQIPDPDNGSAMKAWSVPIEERLHPDLVAQLVEYDPANPPQETTPPQPTHAALVERAKDDMRVRRQPILVVLDGLQASALAKGLGAEALTIETAKQGLRDITQTDLSGWASYEDMRLAIKARYAELAAALPPQVRLAFAQALT